MIHQLAFNFFSLFFSEECLLRFNWPPFSLKLWVLQEEETLIFLVSWDGPVKTPTWGLTIAAPQRIRSYPNLFFFWSFFPSSLNIRQFKQFFGSICLFIWLGGRYCFWKIDCDSVIPHPLHLQQKHTCLRFPSAPGPSSLIQTAGA